MPARLITDRTDRGLRVLVLAGAAAEPGAGLRDAAGLPYAAAAGRCSARRARRRAATRRRRSHPAFHADGVTIKVLSGDDPRTVAALAARAGLGGGTPVAGSEIDGLDERDARAVVARTTDLRPRRTRAEGADRRRPAPPRPLRRHDRRRDQRRASAQGRPSRRGDAQRQRGQPATSPTSCSSTTPSPRCSPARREGRRIINGIAVSMYVFLARVATQGLVILAVTMLGLGFPIHRPRSG